MISTSGLTYRYPGGEGITDISIVVAAGESCALIGPSGCGKSTLLHCLSGLLAPTSGSISINAPTGLVQQKDALFPWLTVEENVQLGVRRGVPTSATTILDELGVAAHRHKFPGQLSGGERQRVSIARTLVTRPEILLLDEPSSALDAFTREALQDLVLAIQQEHTLTALYVTHHIEEALFLSERILLMGRGYVAGEFRNPLFPDPEARLQGRFYEAAVELRKKLNDVMAAERYR
ncbi:MAG: ATP-binding cassette domain-containing protein [Alkalispirochaeta sp.]